MSIDLSGQRFGYLVVISRSPDARDGRHRWVCLCDCGAKKTIRGDALKNNRTKSCGCQKTSYAHGHSSGNALTSEYRSWSAMIARCCVPSNGMYQRYGAKGIFVCERWRTFENFLADMGTKPSPDHSIERRRNSEGYTPENCRWATRLEQMRNRTNTRLLTIDGITKPQTQWAEEAGTPISRIKSRLAMGWDAKEAVFAPLKIIRRGSRSPD